MRYSIETRDQIYVKNYEFLFFAKNNGKNLRSKYRKKFSSIISLVIDHNSMPQELEDRIKTTSVFR